MTRTQTPRSRPPTPRWALVAVALALPVLGGLFLAQAAPQMRPLLEAADAADPPAAVGRPLRGAPPPPAPVPAFSALRTTPGAVSLTDLRFRPLEVPLYSRLWSRLRMVVRDDAVTVRDRRSGAGVWAGPLTAASFLEQTVDGVHTLRDGRGRVLWTDAAEVGRPDLLFQRAADGRGSLTGRGGVRLWSGPLPPAPVPRQARIAETGRGITLIADGIRVSGAGGDFQVCDGGGRRLWAGRLPARPVFVSRSERGFRLFGPRGIVGGWNGTARLRLEAAPGTVTVADASGHTLGRLPTRLLSLRETAQQAGRPLAADRTLAPDRTPDGALGATGTVLLTYQDAAGRVVRRSKVFREPHCPSQFIG